MGSEAGGLKGWLRRIGDAPQPAAAPAGRGGAPSQRSASSARRAMGRSVPTCTTASTPAAGSSVSAARIVHSVEEGLARTARQERVREGDAELDAQAEHDLFRCSRALAAGRTLLLISHRFSTVRMADRIAVLEHGGIVEEGSHSELVARGHLRRPVRDAGRPVPVAGASGTRRGRRTATPETAEEGRTDGDVRARPRGPARGVELAAGGGSAAPRTAEPPPLGPRDRLRVPG
jgi:hypothetical protein